MLRHALAVLIVVAVADVLPPHVGVQPLIAGVLRVHEGKVLFGVQATGPVRVRQIERVLHAGPCFSD